MKEQIVLIREKISELSTELTKYKRALEALQELCTHEWQDDGRDSHYSYEVCKICGRRERT